MGSSDVRPRLRVVSQEPCVSCLLRLPPEHQDVRRRTLVWYGKVGVNRLLPRVCPPVAFLGFPARNPARKPMVYTPKQGIPLRPLRPAGITVLSYSVEEPAEEKVKVTASRRRLRLGIGRLHGYRGET